MKKKNHIKMRFSTLLLCILAILLCTAPRGWAVVLYDGEEHDVWEDIIGCLVIGNGTTVNLYASVEQYVTLGPYSVLNIYSGGSVGQSVYVGYGSVLNIYSGNVGGFISISKDEPYAVVTVYGKDFADELGLVVYGQWLPEVNEEGYRKELLTGQYEDGSTINLLILSDIPINLQQPPPSGGQKEITIDIKPGGNPNNINLRSKGVVPVAVLTTLTTDDEDGFDASTIDPTTVEFAGTEPIRWKICDVDEDGDKDMLFHFKTEDLNLDADSTEATLTIETNNGVISGTDTVRIVQSKKK